MRLQRRLRNVDHHGDRHLDKHDDDPATSRLDARRSRVAAVDAAIAVVAGRAALPAGEVIDLLLDLRSRIASSRF